MISFLAFHLRFTESCKGRLRLTGPKKCNDAPTKVVTMERLKALWQSKTGFSHSQESSTPYQVWSLGNLIMDYVSHWLLSSASHWKVYKCSSKTEGKFWFWKRNVKFLDFFGFTLWFRKREKNSIFCPPDLKKSQQKKIKFSEFFLLWNAFEVFATKFVNINHFKQFLKMLATNFLIFWQFFLNFMVWEVMPIPQNSFSAKRCHSYC